jgi:hypothetical protein
MKKYIAMSIATAFVVTSASATDWDSIPFAKTYPLDAQVTTQVPVKAVKKVVKTTVKKVAAKAPAKVKAVASTSSDAAKIKKLEKSLKQLKKQVSKIKAHDSHDNIKWSVDFRTSHDTIEYNTASGKKLKNDSIFSNRLWLDMAYAASPSMIFKGRLSYNKAYGAAPAYSSGSLQGFPQRGFGYDKFDWIINESLTDNELRVREAYWLYMSESLLGTDIDWTASFGRRPSTNGFLANLRDDDKPKSPMGHVINMEFDGASFKFGLEKLTGVSGMYWKACLGRGLSNARARFNFDTGLDSAGDYTEDKTTLKNIDLAGFIFVPYDDGQYKMVTTYYRGFDVPGFVMANGQLEGQADGTIATEAGAGSMVTAMKANFDETGSYQGMGAVGLNPGLQLQNLGDMDGAAVSLLIDGIGEGLGDFADGVKLFASYGWSKSTPNNKLKAVDVSAFNGFVGKKPWEIAGGLNQMMGTTLSTTPQDYMDPQGQSSQQLGGAMIDAANAGRGEAGMLGSKDSETGTSYWVGAQWPCLLADDAVVGVEYNHGSKYWRPFTYGEDTLIGSKLATRGDAFEVYWTKQLSEAFSIQARYTKINYDYTGSQGFFGAGGTPMTMEEARGAGMDPIEDAQDIRVYARYRF